MKGPQDTFSDSGTNIDDVKRKNERSGMSYNEVKIMLANAIVKKDTIYHNEENSIESKNQSIH
ncbi:MAG: hypothetical protein ACE3JQ_11895 [Paenisporosarcina sp.]